MPYKPRLTHNARPATYTVDARDETGATVPTPIAGEHPLTLYVDKKELVTLMTLGAAPEALAIGFLRNQRLVESIEEIASVQVDWEVNAVVVTTHEICTNGLIHGRPPVLVRAWTRPDRVHCTITDHGNGHDHFLAGQVLPDSANIAQAQESLREAYEIADLIIPGHDNLFLNPRAQGM